MSQPVLQLDNVGIVYRQYKKPIDAFWEIFTSKPRHKEHHALRDIHLQLDKHSSLGVIGDNGAGKSTLLKLLAGNLHASTGTIEVVGRRSAILELGGGFHPEFTGWENARIGLSLAGLSTQEIDTCLPEVIAFAELGEFIHQPVKTYSSGMFVRLAFSVAIAVKPDVLIVDEALSVGDQYFQKKSLDRMRSVCESGTSLVFCSHNLYQIKEMCSQAVWLEKGSVRQFGDVNSVVDAYQDAMRRKMVQQQATVSHKKPTGPRLENINLGGYSESDDLPVFRTGQTFSISTEISLYDHSIKDVHLGIVIRRNDDVQCYGISTLHENIALRKLGRHHCGIRFVIDQLPLLSGQYCLEVWLIDSSGIHIYDSRERCCHFRVRQTSQNEGVGMMIMPHRWEAVRDIQSVA